MKSFLSPIAFICSWACALGAEPLTLNIWPGQPPGESRELPPEGDQTKDSDRLVGGRRIIKLGNVSTPQIAVYRPSPDKDNGAAVVICPGGGHNILAYDLEGTEVADWLNTLGVTGIVLKYRVPTRTPKDRRWLAAVQDAQRAVSLVRSRAGEWGIDPKRIGILGFRRAARPRRSRPCSPNGSMSPSTGWTAFRAGPILQCSFIRPDSPSGARKSRA